MYIFKDIILLFVGMTQADQNEVLSKFDNGICKIMIATSVAQEGIHIEDCESVIMYGCTTDDVGRMQSKGLVHSIYLI